MIRRANTISLWLVILRTLAVLFVGVLFWQSHAGAEGQITVDPTGQNEGYSAILYNNTNGLPTSEANAIAETSEGFLWIGSYSGLIRYDGNTFERIDSTTGIASVVSLYVDSKDRLWIGTNDSGVAVMEKGKFRMYRKTDGLTSLSIRAITEDFEGNIYLATTNGISVIDTQMKLSSLKDSRVENAYISDLRIGNDGILYGTTVNDEFFTIEKGKVTSFDNKEQMGIEGILSALADPVNPHQVYIGTEYSQVYQMDLSHGFEIVKEIDISPLTYVKSMEAYQGEIWICADNGIGVLKEDGFQKIENIPLNNSIDHMMVDYQGNLWFTSSRQGVMKIVSNQFSDLFEKYGLPAMVVNSTCLQNDYLFIGTDSGLVVLSGDGVVNSIPLSRAETASGIPLETTDLIDFLDGCRIRSIIRDSQNAIWISTWKKYGLLRYCDGVLTSFSTAEGLPTDRIRAIDEGADGTILVACTGGVALIQENQVTKVYGEDIGIENTEVLTVVEAVNKDIVLGTDGGGIYVISGDKATHVGIDSGLSSEVVMRIKRDNTRNIFWIVTSNSIAYMTGDYEVTTVQKFPYSNNFDLYENQQGEFWILSSNGIYVTSAEELLANNEITTVFYGRDNGLPYIATANSYSELTKEGELYIAGTTGVAKINIEISFESVSHVKMTVPYVEADGEFIYPDENGVFTLSSDMKRLTIYPYVYTYSLLNPLVTYYLDGFENIKNVIDRSELVPVNYTNLKGGSYHFVMELSDSMGHSNEEYSILIVKQKAFYEEVWFYVLCGIAVILIILVLFRLYVRYKTQRYQKSVEENKLLIRSITQCFAKTIDMKDKYTNGHSFRVAEYTAMLTKELGYDEETVEKYYNCALLHDIGKIGIPEELLNKKGKLTDEEYAIIKSHTTLGYEALESIKIMPELAIAARSHHERPDGKGYPDGLSGAEIPRVAQIISVADAFDAMYSNRPYRSRMNFNKVVSIITEVSGTQLATDVVHAFLRLVGKGEFRDPNDNGEGSTEDIDNIRRRLQEEE